MRTELRGLYAITPEGLPQEILLQRVAAALAGGVALLQWRDKRAVGNPERRACAEAMLALCRQFSRPLIINDDLQLALAIGADGVHLGADDGDLAAARAVLGPERLLGASCYADFARAQRAVAAGADYIAFGAVHPSPTKPGAAPAPLDLFSRARSELRVPVCAIGGITVANAASVLAAGADLLAVITDLFSAADVAARAQAYHHLFEEFPVHDLA